MSDDVALWHDFAPILFPSARVGAAAVESDDLLSLLRLVPDASILDLPCGVGRHSIELARRGFRVTGADLCDMYLDDARAVAASSGVTVEWVRADMRTFERPGAFDVILNLWTSFGYCSTREQDLEVLRHFHSSLKPGGRLVLELKGKENLAAQFQERVWNHEEGGVLFIQERELLEAWSRVRTVWTLIHPDGRRIEHSFTLNIYSAFELMEMCRAAGFVKAKAFGGFKGEPYDNTARRLLVVATR